MQITKTYENDGISRYLCIRLKEDQRVNTYQLRVVENIRPDFALPVTLREEGGEQKLYYLTDSRSDLDRTIEEKGNLSRSQFVTLFKSILEVFLTEKRQQLKPEYFIIHPEYIFFKRNSGYQHPELVYLPADNVSEDLLSQIRSLLRYLIPLKVNYSEAEIFYRKILEVSNSSTFTLNELNDILSQADSAPKPEEKPKIVVSRASEDSSSLAARNDAKPLAADKPKKIEPVKPDAKEKSGIAVNKQPEEENTANVSSVNRTIIIALIQALFVLISIAAAVSLELTEPKSIFGFILLAIALDALVVYLVIKKLPAPANSKQGKKAGSVQKIEKQPAVKHSVQQPVKSEDHQVRIQQKEEKIRFDEKTEVLFPPVQQENQAGEKTELLIKKSKLIRVQDGAEIPLIPNKKIKIGRRSGNDIIILNKTVSGLHAEIEMVQGEYYIRDLNSSNFTYVNGAKLIAEDPHPLKDGDTIMFADVEFKFQK